MRLINTETGEFEEFFDLSTTPPYAILSHTWYSDGEQTYQEVIKIQDKYRRRSSARNILPIWRFKSHFLRSIFHLNSGLSEKIRRACEVARGEGYRYIWIDSSCINKDSSSELSEAINSMFHWYRGAQVCYAFLPDVPSQEDVRAEDSKFRQSRWFKRGWTLQELIAPLMVVFLSRDWKGLGTKDALADVIQDITSIDHRILTHKKALSDESVAGRMRWAANRQTTRVEDEAYSLLGIFEITMTTLYGEGRHAFRRLQEEILRRIPDQSLFAWGSQCIPFPMTPRCDIIVSLGETPTIFAPSPHSFASSSRGAIIRATVDLIKSDSLELPAEEYTHTPYGIRTQLCLLPLKALNPKLGITCDTMPWYLVILRTQHTDHRQQLLGRLCYLHIHQDNVEFLHVPDSMRLLQSGPILVEASEAIIFTLSLNDLKGVTKQLETKTVYLPYLKSSAAKRQIRQLRQERDRSLTLTLPTWVRDALVMRGYTISNIQGPAQHDPNSFSFTLHHAPFNIHVHYRYMVIDSITNVDTAAVVIEARVWVLVSPREPALPDSAAIQCSPPYTSTTWADCQEWAATLPPRSLNVIADSGSEVTLTLGLDLLAPSRYSIRVEVVPASTAGISASWTRTRPYHLGDVLGRNFAHDTFNLLLSGAVRRALKTQGYSARLDLVPSEGGKFHSHSLTISPNRVGRHSQFAIVVKYFHTLGPSYHFRDCQELAVIAHVTLESTDSEASDVFQDGPHVVIWKDTNSRSCWEWSLEEKPVVLTTPSGTLLTLLLGFHLAWQSEYYLSADISPTTPFLFQPLAPEPPALRGSIHGGWCELGEDENTLNRWAHEGISFILPGHIKRGLVKQGFRVTFKELSLDEGDESHNSQSTTHHDVLTLHHVEAGITIIVNYSHRLITHNTGQGSDHVKDKCTFLLADPRPDSAADSGAPAGTVKWSFKPCRQELTFRASVQTLPSPSHGTQASAPSQEAAQDDVTETITVDWDERDVQSNSEGTSDWLGWRRQLPKKDIALALPTGSGPLSLRLGFDLVWYSEYCLTVEIISPASDATLSVRGFSTQGDTSDWLRAIRDWHGERSVEHGGAQNRPVVAGGNEPPWADPNTFFASEGSLVGSQEGTGGEDGPHSIEERVPSGSGA